MSHVGDAILATPKTKCPVQTEWMGSMTWAYTVQLYRGDFNEYTQHCVEDRRDFPKLSPFAS